jgi:hypothetical protein
MTNLCFNAKLAESRTTRRGISPAPHRATATMLRLSEPQRAVLADKIGDAANLAAGALVFSQFLSDGEPSPTFVVLGSTLWLTLVALSVVVAGRRAS